MTGINARKIIQNLQFLNSRIAITAGDASLAIFTALWASSA
jgi:hypothetical protein